MSKKIILLICVVIGIVVLVGIKPNLYSPFIPDRIPDSDNVRPPKIIERPNEGTISYDGGKTWVPVNRDEPVEPVEPQDELLDFNEVIRFTTLEEIGDIRFLMSIDRQYGEYTYHGTVSQDGYVVGEIHEIDSSEIEYEKISEFGIILGGNWPFRFHFDGYDILYRAEAIEVDSDFLKLRVQDIWKQTK